MIFVTSSLVCSKALQYRTEECGSMGKSKEFDRDGDADVKKVVTRTGPLGLVPILYILVSLFVLIGMVLWWRG